MGVMELVYIFDLKSKFCGFESRRPYQISIKGNAMTSVDYAELAGLSITLTRFKFIENKTDEEVSAEKWIKNRIKVLEDLKKK